MPSSLSDSNRRIARNSIFLTLRMFVVLIITLFTTRVLLKTLGVVDYGVYNVVCGFVSMFTFLNVSMTNGIQRFYNFSLGNNSDFSMTEVFNTALRIQFILAILIITLTETIGLWYLYYKMNIPPERFYAAKWIFQFSVVSFLLIIMQVPFSASILAQEHMDFYAFVSVLDAILKLLIAFSLQFFTLDHLIVYGALLLGISVINFLLYYTYSHKRFTEIRISRVKKKKLFSSMLSFSGWNVFGSFSGIMKGQGINLVLNYFGGPIVNAAQGVASQVSGALQGIVSNMTVAIRPQVIKSYASGNINRTMRLTYSISKLSCCFLYLVSWPVILEISYILSIWLGDVVPEHTSSFVILVLLVSFVNLLNAAVSGVIHATGKMMVYQVVSSTISVLCVPAAYIAMRFGAAAESAFICTFVFSALSHIVSLFILRSLVQYSIRDYVKKIIYPFIILVSITFLFPLLIHYLLPEGFLRLILVLLASLFSIAPVSYFVTIDSDERNMIKSFIQSFKQRIWKKR